MDMQITKYQNLITDLILNSHFIDNIGLLHGKMGLAIQFYQLARKTGNQAFDIVAGELIDNITSDLSFELPPDFENGLGGIGWGIEFLIQNRFLDPDGTDLLLAEFDKRIFRTFLKDVPTNINLLNGVLGTGHYFLMRVRGAEQAPKNVITETNRIALQDICKHFSMVLPQIADYLKEPVSSPNDTMQHDTISAPIFDITWNLPVLIGFLAEIFDLNTLQSAPAKLSVEILTSLDADFNLPLLQCNRLLLLLSLIKLKNSLQLTSGGYVNEICMLTNKITGKISAGIDDRKYTHELTGLDLSIRNGIPGIALINYNLYEQTRDLKYKLEYVNLLEKFMPDSFINQFRYDYSNPSKTCKYGLGPLQGISGLFLTSACI
jgi:hypothetical protein